MVPTSSAGGGRGHYSVEVETTSQSLTVQAYQHLLTTTDLFQFTQSIMAISHIMDDSTEDWILDERILDTVDHLKVVVRQSAAEQVNGTNWEDSLVRIICSLPDFWGNTEPLYVCIAELLEDQRFPCLTNPEAMAEVIENLHPLLCDSKGRATILNALAGHICRMDHLNPAAICALLNAFKDYDRQSVGPETVLAAVAPHISRADQFSPERMAHALESLMNFKTSRETTQVLKALITHISLADPLDKETISTLFTCLPELSDEDINAAVSALILHVTHIADFDFTLTLFKTTLQGWGSCASAKYLLIPFAEQLCFYEQLDAQVIGSLLHQLKQLKITEGSTALMNALESHICGAEQFGFLEISHAVSCLKHLTCDPELVLQALMRQIDNTPNALWIKGDDANLMRLAQNNSRFWSHFMILKSTHGQWFAWSFCLVADAIDNLSWLLQNKSEAATTLISTLLKKINYAFDIEKLTSISEQKMLMKDLLKDRRTKGQIDLRGLPTNLAEFCLHAALNERRNQKSTMAQLNLVYGKLGQVLYKKSTLSPLKIIYASPDLKSLIEQSISKEVESGEWNATWSECFVMLN